MTGPSLRAWKPRPGRSRTAAEAEQDRAAGGPYRRAVRLSGGDTSRATIVLRPAIGADEVRAYVRWRVGGRTVERSLGPVIGGTRKSNLAAGWALARGRGLVHDEETPPDSWAASPEVRASMRGNRGRDTRPERHLRAVLHAHGLRYRVSTRPLPGLRRTADVVFPKARVAVFVDGCYWHGCPEHHRPATKNSSFWQAKIADNRRRDEETNRALAEEGWAVIRCWEHDEPEEVAERVMSAVANQGRGES